MVSRARTKRRFLVPLNGFLREWNSASSLPVYRKNGNCSLSSSHETKHCSDFPNCQAHRSVSKGLQQVRADSLLGPICSIAIATVYVRESCSQGADVFLSHWRKTKNIVKLIVKPEEGWKGVADGTVKALHLFDTHITGDGMLLVTRVFHVLQCLGLHIVSVFEQLTLLGTLESIFDKLQDLICRINASFLACVQDLHTVRLIDNEWGRFLQDDLPLIIFFTHIVPCYGVF